MIVDELEILVVNHQSTVKVRQ